MSEIRYIENRSVSTLRFTADSHRARHHTDRDDTLLFPGSGFDTGLFGVGPCALRRAGDRETSLRPATRPGPGKRCPRPWQAMRPRLLRCRPADATLRLAAEGGGFPRARHGEPRILRPSRTGWQRA